MTRQTPERLIGKLVIDFLGTEESRTAGVPAAADVALRLEDDGRENRLPQIVIMSEEVEGKSAGKRMIDVFVLLDYLLRNGEADAPTDVRSLARSTTADQAHEWMDAVESRLRDLDALGLFLAGLDGDFRAGWVIMKWTVMPSQEIKRDKGAEGDMIRLRCGLKVLLAWSARV